MSIFLAPCTETITPNAYHCKQEAYLLLTYCSVVNLVKESLGCFLKNTNLTLDLQRMLEIG